MKKNKYLLIITLLSLLYPIKTHAECTKEEIDYFKQIESKYKVTYEFNKSTKDYTLTYHIANPEKYDYAITSGITEDILVEFNKINDNVIEVNKIPPGNYTIEVMGITETCNDTLKKINLKLPNYNKYSEDPLCEGIEEFVLCQPTYDKEIDYETFSSRVATYKKNLKQNETTDDIDEITEEENKIITYLKNNMFQVITVSIFIILIIITIILTASSVKKSRRLE